MTESESDLDTATNYEVRCPDCNALVATEHGEKADLARRDGVTFPCEPCAIRRCDKQALRPGWDFTVRRDPPFYDTRTSGHPDGQAE